MSSPANDRAMSCSMARVMECVWRLGLTSVQRAHCRDLAVRRRHRNVKDLISGAPIPAEISPIKIEDDRKATQEELLRLIGDEVAKLSKDCVPEGLNIE